MLHQINRSIEQSSSNHQSKKKKNRQANKQASHAPTIWRVATSSSATERARRDKIKKRISSGKQRSCQIIAPNDIADRQTER